MSDIKIQPSATGTATVTLTAPVTNTARTITFPDSTSTLLASDGSGASLTNLPADSSKLSLAGGAMTGALTVRSSSENVNTVLLAIGNDVHASNTKDAWIRYEASTGGSADQTFAIGAVNNSFRFVHLGTRATAPLSGTELMRIDSTGNLGIGATPEAWKTDQKVLQVGAGAVFAGSTDTSNPDTNITNNAYFDNNTSGNNRWEYINTSPATRYALRYDGKHIFYTAASGSADAAVSWITAMSINASGNTYFGGLALADGTAEIRGAGADAGKITIRRTSGSNKQMIGFYNGSTFVGEVNTNTSSTTYATSSDYRLKENVNYTWDATTRLKQLKPARFNFKANDSLTLDGFLAHEVSDIVPEAIIGTKDALDSDSNPVYQGIDQSKLVPLLVKTIQELEARLTAGGL